MAREKAHARGPKICETDCAVSTRVRTIRQLLPGHARCEHAASRGCHLVWLLLVVQTMMRVGLCIALLLFSACRSDVPLEALPYSDVEGSILGMPFTPTYGYAVGTRIYLAPDPIVCGHALESPGLVMAIDLPERSRDAFDAVPVRVYQGVDEVLSTEDAQVEVDDFAVSDANLPHLEYLRTVDLTLDIETVVDGVEASAHGSLEVNICDPYPRIFAWECLFCRSYVD